MTETADSAPPPSGTTPDNWAEPVERLSVDTPAGPAEVTVEGREVAGPLQGFGQMWRKTYRVRLDGVQVSPEEVIRAWMRDFSQYWPGENRFYKPLTGLKPGEVGLIDLTVGGGLKLSTGMMVMHADPRSFTLITPQGHMFAGWIIFGSVREGITTFAQVQALIRASDPLYELGFRLGIGHKVEDTFWKETLRNLAKAWNARPVLSQRTERLARNVQWRYAGNIRHNAAVRTVLYQLAWPLRRALRWLPRRTQDKKP
jgi:hypothetical protein